ncbi:hypothetical protein MY4824_004146 [Beauveria thailandica]
MTRNKVTHSDVAQVLAPRERLFTRASKTSSTVRLENAGAVIFSYNSAFRLRWPNKGDPDEGNIPTNSLEETSDFLDGAIGAKRKRAEDLTERQLYRQPGQGPLRPPHLDPR